jgi:transitional endoplasmic reticulum ATPase
VIVLAATNRPELIDPALLRPGRFDMVVELEYPDEEARRAIFAVHTRGRPLAPEITLDELAALTAGRSGADIEAICRRASLLALREWISPKLQLARVQVTEEKGDEGQASATTAETSEGAGTAEVSGQNGQMDENSQNSQNGQNSQDGATQPATRFEIRPEHFAQAIDEQRERYAVQEEAEAARTRQEAGRQRLLEIAAGQQEPKQKRPLRGFRLWIARLLGLVP